MGSWRAIAFFGYPEGAAKRFPGAFRGQLPFAERFAHFPGTTRARYMQSLEIPIRRLNSPFPGIAREPRSIPTQSPLGWVCLDSRTIVLSIQRTQDPASAAIKDVRIYLGGRNVRMTQQFLNRANIVSRFQQMRRERMT